jgi:hypothetical protein
MPKNVSETLESNRGANRGGCKRGLRMVFREDEMNCELDRVQSLTTWERIKFALGFGLPDWYVLDTEISEEGNSQTFHKLIAAESRLNVLRQYYDVRRIEARLDK